MQPAWLALAVLASGVLSRLPAPRAPQSAALLVSVPLAAAPSFDLLHSEHAPALDKLVPTRSLCRYDGRFMQIFDEIYRTKYQAQFENLGIW